MKRSQDFIVDSIVDPIDAGSINPIAINSFVPTPLILSLVQLLPTLLLILVLILVLIPLLMLLPILLPMILILLVYCC